MLLLMVLSLPAASFSFYAFPTGNAHPREVRLNKETIRRRPYRQSFTLHETIQSEPKNVTAGGSSIPKKGNDNSDELFAQSVFGTKQYWDDLYKGFGDFNADQYSWYFGWETIRPFWHTATRLLLHEKDDKITSCSDTTFGSTQTKSYKRSTQTQTRVLLPGIGNDSDLVYKLYTSSDRIINITAIDYSSYAIERQIDILSYLLPSCYQNINFFHMDARYLNPTWTRSFDIILEKGTLDAIYLSSSSAEDHVNLKLAISELYRVLRPGGALLSISGVVPDHVRRELFSTDTDSEWEWIRDGGTDLQAGCFILRKKLL